MTMSITTDFQDSFTEASDTDLASHTPDTGTGWTEEVGAANYAIVASATNTLNTNNTGPGVYVGDDISSANMGVYFKSKVLSSANSNSIAGINIVDASNGIGFRLAGTGASGSRLTNRLVGVNYDLILRQGVDEEWIGIQRIDSSTVQFYEAGTGASPGTWNQLGTDQTVTDHNTEVSHGIIVKDAGGEWLDNWYAGPYAVASTGNSNLLLMGYGS